MDFTRQLLGEDYLFSIQSRLLFSFISFYFSFFPFQILLGVLLLECRF